MDKVKGDEANFKTQSEAQKIEIEDLWKQLAWKDHDAQEGGELGFSKNQH